MPLRPLAPMSPARIEWETQVTHHVCELADVSNGDAQAILEADPDGVDRLFTLRMTPRAAAMAVLDIKGEQESAPGTDTSAAATALMRSEPLPEVTAVTVESSNWPFGPQLTGREEWNNKLSRLISAKQAPELDAPTAMRLYARQLDDLYSDGSSANHAFECIWWEREQLADQKLTLRTELEQVKRANVGAMASLVKAREERDKLRALAIELMGALHKMQEAHDPASFEYCARDALKKAQELGL